MAEPLSNYQTRDYNVVDYQMYELDGAGLWFRGPKAPLTPGRYFTCIGAAQTFGCLCQRPFPQLLSARLGMPALNLGYGGAGPEFFDRQGALDPYLNNGAFVVVQVLSGRSQSNSEFECHGLEYQTRRSDGVSMGANEAYCELLAGSPRLRRLPPRRIWGRVARLAARPRIRRLIDETRRAWVESYRRWLSRITAPVILFWFSKRSPDYIESFRSIYSLFGAYPQLIDGRTVDQVRLLVDNYVQCVTDRGSPQPLVSRFTGTPVTVDPALDRPDLGVGPPWTHNRYYPSPEMHEDAAESLLPTCEALLKRGLPMARAAGGGERRP
jgi:hypothetical protein